ncbi:hypothetical protein [Gordonia terrae]
MDRDGSSGVGVGASPVVVPLGVSGSGVSTVGVGGAGSLPSAASLVSGKPGVSGSPEAVGAVPESSAGVLSEGSTSELVAGESGPSASDAELSAAELSSLLELETPDAGSAPPSAAATATGLAISRAAAIPDDAARRLVTVNFLTDDLDTKPSSL